MKEVEKTSDEELLGVVKAHTQGDIASLEQDICAILFFKDIYNKSDMYFKIVRSKLSSELSKVLLKVDEEL